MDPEYRRVEVTTQVSNKIYITFLDKKILSYFLMLYILWN